jgi:hypothetical protein
VEAFLAPGMGVFPFEWKIIFPYPLKPLTRKYKLMGGFMTLSEADHFMVLEAMAKIAAVNSTTRFDGSVAKTIIKTFPCKKILAEVVNMAKKETDIASQQLDKAKSNWEPVYPARVELLSMRNNTPSIFRVMRANSKLLKRVASYKEKYNCKGWPTAKNFIEPILKGDINYNCTLMALWGENAKINRECISDMLRREEYVPQGQRYVTQLYYNKSQGIHCKIDFYHGKIKGMPPPPLPLPYQASKTKSLKISFRKPVIQPSDSEGPDEGDLSGKVSELESEEGEWQDNATQQLEITSSAPNPSKLPTGKIVKINVHPRVHPLHT